MGFLYVLSDGAAFHKDDPPTDVELFQMQNGQLSVFQVVGGKNVRIDPQEWLKTADTAEN